MKKKVAIIGASGYTGGELLRLLLKHPELEVVSACSKHSSGKFVYEIHPDLFGETDLKFSDIPETDADIWFLCLQHGESINYLSSSSVLPNKIIDLSRDFRPPSDVHFNDEEFIYGLTEAYQATISGARYIANPGCFATAMQLALLPLATYQLLSNDVFVTAVTGSTGAGKKLSDSTHFSRRFANHSTYNLFTHPHTAEVETQLAMNGASNCKLNFIPSRGNFSRGIHASCVFKSDLSVAHISDIVFNYYRNSPFVSLVPFEPELKQVVNTNKCFLHVQSDGNFIAITSVIDNLLKGAAGQAVQNMNLMFGFNETCGLDLKPLAY